MLAARSSEKLEQTNGPTRSNNAEVYRLTFRNFHGNVISCFLNVQNESSRIQRHAMRHLQWSSLAAMIFFRSSVPETILRVFHCTYPVKFTSATDVRQSPLCRTLLLQWGVVIFRAQLAFWLLANVHMKEPHRFKASAATVLHALTLHFIQKVRRWQGYWKRIVDCGITHLSWLFTSVSCVNNRIKIVCTHSISKLQWIV